MTKRNTANDASPVDSDDGRRRRHATGAWSRLVGAITEPATLRSVITTLGVLLGLVVIGLIIALSSGGSINIGEPSARALIVELETTQSRMAELTAVLNQVRADIALLRQDSANLRLQLDGLEAQAQNLEARIGEVEARLTRHAPPDDGD